MKLAETLSKHSDDLALLLGNGINRYRSSAQLNSWDALLMKVAAQCGAGLETVPKGTTLTEFYDVLRLGSDERKLDLAAEFCKLMKDWRPVSHHRRVTSWAESRSVPVLTTNFDEVLSEAGQYAFRRFRSKSFTDYYPWECYFASADLADPCAGFGIWHVNGMARYRRSIRLGLTDYMGSVHKARGWLHRSDDRLFAEKNQRRWPGADTWMHIMFNKPLLIVGLALEENEAFLRWLLIERARYFKKFPGRRKAGWFAYKPDRSDDREAGRLFFLRAIGFECIPVGNYDELYADQTWAN